MKEEIKLLQMALDYIRRSKQMLTEKYGVIYANKPLVEEKIEEYLERNSNEKM